MGTHEPLRQEWPVLALDVEGEPEEIPDRSTSAPCSAAVARPRRATRDVDVVVAGNLLAHRNIAACHEERAVALVKHVHIGVATVIDVSIWIAQ